MVVSLLLAQILCDLNHPGCRLGYPSRPERYSQRGQVTATFAQIRARAAKEGWEVRQGTRYGKDACPPCRIVEIRQVEREAKDEGGSG